MIEFFNYLNAIKPLSGDATAALMKVLRAKELRRGQVWLQEGAVCDKMTFVVKGLLKMYFEPAQKELVMGLARENEFCISAQSFFRRSPSAYTIRSVEPSVVAYVPLNELELLIERCPELIEHAKRIADIQFSALEYHTSLLQLTPMQRFEQLARDHAWMMDGSRLSDRLVAGYLGTGVNGFWNWRRGIL